MSARDRNKSIIQTTKITKHPPILTYRFCCFCFCNIHLFSCAGSQSRHSGSSVFIAACGIFRCGMRTLSCSMWDLVPWTGIDPGPPVLQPWTLSHWTIKEVSVFHHAHFLFSICNLFSFPSVLCVFLSSLFFPPIYLFFNWKIIALQNFVVFCQTSTWISHRYTYIPSLLNLPPLSLPIPAL